MTAPDPADGLGLLAGLSSVNLLLASGVVAVVASRRLGLSPIVGYLVLGLLLGVVSGRMGWEPLSRALRHPGLAELGMVFLLFDIGLHFPVAQLRDRAKDILGFGPVQVAFATAGIAGAASLLGVALGPALILGATLSLSSTAVVVALIAERQQQTCPVGQTATAILIFQDLAAIVLLIVGEAVGTDQAVGSMIGAAVVNGALACAAAALLGRFVVPPLFEAVARTRSAEVFTAVALLVALTAAWATGAAGLSLTFGAFLGGMIISDNPYRLVIQSEIRPFRGLLLGFFFIGVGASIDVGVLAGAWATVLGVAVVLVGIKILTNGAASLVFGWSVPGSAQLGFLLAQGSEFAFVILSLPKVRALVGPQLGAVLIASVALSLALTPFLAGIGRDLAGRLRRPTPGTLDAELRPGAGSVEVLIAGMGQVGRTVADALTAMGIGYAALERDDVRLSEAVADGYAVSFGDLSDPHNWASLAAYTPRLVVLTAPLFASSQALVAAVDHSFPGVTRVAAVRDETEAARFRSIGLKPVVTGAASAGFDVAASVLHELEVGADRIASWIEAHHARSASPLPAVSG